MSQYQPYPAYKASGVEWLGRVPEHWIVGRLRHSTDGALSYGANEAAESDDPRHPRFIRITDLNEDGTLRDDTFKSLPPDVARPYLLRDGDVLLARSGATVGKSFIYRIGMGDACYAGYLIRVRLLKSKFLSKLFWYCTQSSYYWDFIGGSSIQATIQNVSGEKYANLWLAIPPLTEQWGIVSKLDRETARIDALIEKKSRFIELLREKRQALITQAVTKGLDPSVKMKDSGVEWLGEVPEHWSFGRLAYACELIVDGTHHSPESYPEGAFKYITAKNIKEHGFDFTELTYLSADQHQEIYSRCSVKAGDVLYIKDGATAGVAMVNYLDEEFSLLSSVAVIRPKKKRLLSEYLAYLLNSGGFKTSVLSRLVGGAITRFTLEMIGNFSVSLPSIEEQRQVVAHLEGIVPRLDVLKGKTERSIELLKERRSALITAAVTGQIDLREAV